MPNVKKDGIAARRELPRVRLRPADALRPLRAVHRLQQLSGVQVHPQPRRAVAHGPRRRATARPRRRSRPARSAASRWRSSAAASAPSTAAPAIRSARTSARPAPSRRRRCRRASPARSAARGRSSRSSSHRGKTFWSCNRYPDCKFSLWKKPVIKRLPALRRHLPPREGHQEARRSSTSATPRGAATSRTPSAVEALGLTAGRSPAPDPRQGRQRQGPQASFRLSVRNIAPSKPGERSAQAFPPPGGLRPRPPASSRSRPRGAAPALPRQRRGGGDQHRPSRRPARTPTRPLARRLAETRRELLDGSDAWRRRFGAAAPGRRAVLLGEAAGDCTPAPRSALIAEPEGLEAFFRDTSLGVTYTVDPERGTAELSIVPGTSTRATRRQREEMERDARRLDRRRRRIPPGRPGSLRLSRRPAGPRPPLLRRPVRGAAEREGRRDPSPLTAEEKRKLDRLDGAMETGPGGPRRARGRRLLAGRGLPPGLRPLPRPAHPQAAGHSSRPSRASCPARTAP